MMADCIYCGAPANSKEHWLPRGFGAIKGITLLQDRVCEACNNALGEELDQEVLRTGPTGFAKSLLKIEGRHRKTVNPFHYKVMAKESATTMTMQSPYGDYKILAQAYTGADGKGHARALRQLVFEKGDEIICVPFPPAYDGPRLAALLKERGVDGLMPKEIYLDPQEQLDNLDVRRVLTDAIGSFSQLPVYGGLSPSGARQNVLLKAGISSRYLRGLAKIGFHYYLAMSPIHTGGELIFGAVRRFIREGEGDWRSFIELTVPQFIGQLAEGNVPQSYSHFFGSRKVHGDIAAAVQFFVGPDHLVPPSLVRLGISSRVVSDRVHWVSYYGEKIDGYDAEITDVLRPT